MHIEHWGNGTVIVQRVTEEFGIGPIGNFISIRVTIAIGIRFFGIGSQGYLVAIIGAVTVGVRFGWIGTQKVLLDI